MKSKKFDWRNSTDIRYGNPRLVTEEVTPVSVKPFKPVEVAKPIEVPVKPVEVAKPIEVPVKPVEVAKPIEVPVKPVEVAKPIEAPVKPVEVAKKPKQRKRLNKVQVYDKDTTVLDAVCSKMSYSKSQAYKTSLRFYADKLNIL